MKEPMRNIAIVVLFAVGMVLVGCAAPSSGAAPEAGAAKPELSARNPEPALAVKITDLGAAPGPEIPKGTATYEARYVKKIEADGKLGDWKEAKWVELKDKKHMGGEGWAGPEDLSGRFALAFSDEGLCFAAVVTDQEFFNDHAGDGLWQGDSIQIALDPMLDRSVAAYESDDVEIGFALVSGKVDTWRWSGELAGGPGPLADAQISIKRDEDAKLTRYEACIPYRALRPFNPRVMTRCGVDVIINDNDGRGRAFFAEWTGGIASKKDPSCFAVVSFTGGPRPAKPALVGGFRRQTVVVELGEPLEFLLWTNCREPVDAVVETQLVNEAANETKSSRSAITVERGHRKCRVSIATENIQAARYRVNLSLLQQGKKVAPQSSWTVYVVPPRED